MRKLIYIILITVIAASTSAQEAEINIITQNSWPPGTSVPVTIELRTGSKDGFARLYHRLPNGFTVENVNSAGADFFWDNMQINYVWTSLPKNQLIRVRYLAKADVLLSGSFNISGRLDYVVDGNERVSVYSKTIVIQLDKDAEIEDVDSLSLDLKEVLPEKITGNSLESDTKIKPGGDKESELLSKVDFRIQVSSSSNKFSQAELEDRIGVKLSFGVKVLKTGSMYKYQSGSFLTYSEASAYLDELKKGGVSDAFIVAFNRDVQISIKEAEKLLEK